MKERDSILKDFQIHREVSILVSCKTISEGVDLKNANCMMAWDASKSPIDNIQRVGRVLRLYKNANGTIATKEKQTPSTIMIPSFLLAVNLKIVVEIDSGFMTLFLKKLV